MTARPATARPATARPATARPATAQPVAITGMALRVPGADDLATFWLNQLDGVESISFFTPQELAAAGEDPRTSTDPHYVPARGALLDVTSFDAARFGFTHREVELTDPQLTLLLETVWLAMVDAGHDPLTERDLRVGLYAGARSNWYSELAREALDSGWDPVSRLQLRLGTDSDFFATRLSYALNLRGPSMTVQSGCSSSLLAVHLARQALLAGDCDLAVAAGVNVHLPVNRGYLVASGLIESTDGHCRAFDDAASGTVGGDGVVAVVLRRLDDAVAVAERVYGTVVGSAAVNDGDDKVGFTAPSVSGQVAAVRAALDAAGVGVDDIGYVECHGTGTRLGDPLELRALSEALAGRRTGPCLIGSVKANIGHLDAAAGLAGLVKAVLVLRDGVVPPSINVSVPNRAFDWKRSALQLPTARLDWPLPGARMAGVTSLGIGGTNVHVVVRQPPAEAITVAPPRRAAGLRRQPYPLRDAVCRHTPGRMRPRAAAAAPADLLGTVASVFEDALGGGRVQADDFHDRSFFELGGDSLGAIQAVSRLNEAFGLDLDPDLLFDHPSPRAMAEYLVESGVRA